MPSKLALALANEADDNETLCKHLSLSHNEITESSDEELVLRLVQDNPSRFATLLVNKPALRVSLEKIPFIYYYLFRYCYTNEYVLCTEMHTTCMNGWNILTDLWLRSTRKENTEERHSRLCLLFSLNPERPRTFTSDLVLNHEGAKDLLQVLLYGKEDTTISSFFRYNHPALYKECRDNRKFADELAYLYTLFYPFGCPHASYYTSRHQTFRAIVVDLFKALSVASVDDLKRFFPKDRTQHNPLDHPTSPLSVFLDGIWEVVEANRKLMMTAFVDAGLVIVRDDETYERVLGAFFNTKDRLGNLFCTIDAPWLLTFIDVKLRPTLSVDHQITRRFTNLLQQFIVDERKGRASKKMFYEHTDATSSDFCIVGQLMYRHIEVDSFAKEKKEKAEKATTRINEDLIETLSHFLLDTKRSDALVPTAQALLDELQRRKTLPKIMETPLIYWRNSGTSTKEERLEVIYKMLFDQCTNK